MCVPRWQKHDAFVVWKPAEAALARIFQQAITDYIAHEAKEISFGEQPLGRRSIEQPSSQDSFVIEFLFDTEKCGMHGDGLVKTSPGRHLRSKIR